VEGWTMTRPGSLGLLPSGPDPVGEWYVQRQPSAFYIGDWIRKNKIFQLPIPENDLAESLKSSVREAMVDFTLDNRLEADTFAVGNLSLCRVLLIKDARFPWVILVPRRANIREIIDLDLRDRATLYREIEAVSEVMKRLYSPTKLNIAALGNMVAQLHVHIIARFENDSAWPKPVWGVGDPLPYEPEAVEARIAELSDALGRL
jgi:diadenosine tetraphosphate (Ap4A) HIT family hydrolase